MNTQKRGSFRGSIGFVLAAAGSAVGLGNIWRFPYLAARDGGGLFLILYLVLALTFGFCLLMTEVVFGRKTRQSPLTAYRTLKKSFGWLGGLACLIPFLILPYYCAIGGWVLRYLVCFVTGRGSEAAADGYFSAFIGDPVTPVIYTLIFLFAASLIVFLGVDRGIENSSRILMPLLLLMVIGIAVFSLSIHRTDEAGKVIRGLDGLRVYLVPNFEGLTLKKFFYLLTDALGQLFYSLSVAMGIMIAYGSYVPDDADLVKSIGQIEFFDTLVAFLAGIMIIPAVYVFMGSEGMSAGPSLIFISLPKIFAAMGKAGGAIGAIFFAMVLFAALTSAVSIMEAVVSSLMDGFHLNRAKATIVETVSAIAVAILVCLGYNLLYFDQVLPNGAHAQILDILDYISNQILMPVVEIFTCILAGWVLGPNFIMDEALKNGETFSRRGLYTVMIRFIAPLLLLLLLTMSLGLI